MITPTLIAGDTSTAAADNTAAIDSAIQSASAISGGASVAIPAGTYYVGGGSGNTNPIAMASDVNLEISGGATLRNYSPGAAMISESNASNLAITGSGTLDGNATTTQTGNTLVVLDGGSNIYVGSTAGATLASQRGSNATGSLTIENSGGPHLQLERDANVTVNQLTIADAGETGNSGAGGAIPNTDGIDYSGSNFVIQYSSVADGDDDIVAKPAGSAASAHTTNITIQNDSIGAGHGISVGGQTNQGLNGLLINNVNFDGTDNGIRLKSGGAAINSPGGGLVQNVTAENITMTNVATPIIINSWYNGGDHYGSNELTPAALHAPGSAAYGFDPSNPGDPTVLVNDSDNSADYPFFNDINFDNITAAGETANALILYGLNSVDSNSADPLRNINAVSFENVSISGTEPGNIYYTSDLNTAGLTVTVAGGDGSAPNGIYEYGDSVPEPGVGLLALGAVPWLSRRRRRSR